MPYWRGNIEWQVRIRYADSNTYYEAYENQIWVLRGMPTSGIYTAQWTTAGAGKHIGHNVPQDTTEQWTITGTAQVEFRIELVPPASNPSGNKWSIKQWGTRVHIRDGRRTISTDANGNLLRPASDESYERNIGEVQLVQGRRSRVSRDREPPVKKSFPPAGDDAPQAVRSYPRTKICIWRLFWQ
jgi:hypothetical protein